MNILSKSALEALVLEGAACAYLYSQHSEFLTTMAKEAPLETIGAVGMLYTLFTVCAYRINYSLRNLREEK